MMRLVRRTPLRVKLIAWVLCLVAAALFVISIGTAVFLRSFLVSQVDADLKATVTGGRITLATAGSAKVWLPDDYVVFYVGSYGVTESDYAESLAVTELPDTPDDYAGFYAHLNKPYTAKAVDDPHMQWRILVSGQSDGSLLAIGKSLESVDQVVARLIWVDILVGGGVLMLLAAVGAAIVRSSLRPLIEIERTAGAIARGDLSQRVPDPEPNDEEPETELGRLSRALNAMLAQIEQAFTARAMSESAARSAELAARDAAFAAQASEARARRSEERMRQFVADASHELRTPLTTIRGFAELYRQGAAGSPDDVGRLVRRIEDEASRMGLLVEDLLLLARLDRERPVELAPVELRVLAADAVQAARAMAPDRKIELETAPEAGPLVVLGDDGRLRQVLGNLVTNAIRHTPPDAAVTVRLAADPDGFAVIDVVDTGPGLTPEQAERVFERFYRADAARTRRAGDATSTGLGLAIVAALVAAHNGTVEVDSEPGKGATFRVRLPLAAATASEDDDV
ncbi:HAMP domain-containing sensor histidine kinase [Actinomycetes bacterium KLBMP 9797]